MANVSQTEMALEMLRKGVPLERILREARFPELGSYLFEIICRRGLSVEVTSGLAALNRTSLYRILNGETNPTRNVLLRLAIVLDMNINEVQYLLKCGNVSSLSGGKPRDLCIMNGILKKNGIEDINEILRRYGYEDLMAKH